MIEKIKISNNNLELDYNKIYNSCLVDLKQDAPRPPTALGISYHYYKDNSYLNSTFTYGEMSGIVAPQKSKKSFFKSVLEACYIGGESTNYFPEIITCRKKDLYIISFKTESINITISSSVKPFNLNGIYLS